MRCKKSLTIRSPSARLAALPHSPSKSPLRASNSKARAGM
jgi:hypothetical protein